MKGRGCAHVHKQCTYTSNHEASSPTVMTEAVFLTALIDAHEEREVTIVDIPGPFIHADMDELVHMRIDGKMAEMQIAINPDLYGPCVHMELQCMAPCEQ